jgi:hypothetical protein
VRKKTIRGYFREITCKSSAKTEDVHRTLSFRVATNAVKIPFNCFLDIRLERDY